MKKPWTHDHEDLDLAYPMVADEPTDQPMTLNNFLIVLGLVVILWALVYGVARAIDMGNWSW